MVESFRDFGVRLKEFCEIKDYRVIEDNLDYVVLEDSNNKLWHCSGNSVHEAMLKEGIR